MHFRDLATPAVIIDAGALRANLEAMALIHPGRRLRPHVKAHKSTAIAAEQVRAGHRSFTCATPREVIGLARRGIGDDLLLANETLDPVRLGILAALGDSVRVSVAIDSDATLEAAAAAGVRCVVIDVNVGLPRCGVEPGVAGALAGAARRRGLEVLGVMGYEGHLQTVPDPVERRTKVSEAMSLLAAAHAEVGGEIVSAGGTGTHDSFDGTAVTEVQAGSYALMDTHYARLGLPFGQAMWVVGTVISTNPKWSVCDVGLKSLGMDHGNPAIEGHSVWFCSDEHTTFAPLEGTEPLRAGDRVLVAPAHIDPTMSMHDTAHLIDTDGRVIETWPIDLRGW